MANSIVSRHWGIAAIVVPRQVPIIRLLGRRKHSDRKGGLQPDRGCQHFPPHPDKSCGGESTMVPSDESTNNFGLARRLKRRLVAFFFARRHFRHYLRPT